MLVFFFTEKPPSYDTAAASRQPEDGDKYQRFD